VAVDLTVNKYLLVSKTCIAVPILRAILKVKWILCYF